MYVNAFFFLQFKMNYVILEKLEEKMNEKLGLSEELLKSINELGFEKPTPIQENIIPVILEGYDVIGQAQTGTGKTLAFSSILLTNLKERKKKPQAYILSPTRELTMKN